MRHARAAHAMHLEKRSYPRRDYQNMNTCYFLYPLAILENNFTFAVRNILTETDNKNAPARRWYA